MYLGQARIYVKDKLFMIKCEDTTVFDCKRGQSVTINKFDELLNGDILNIEVTAISAKDNLVVFHI